MSDPQELVGRPLTSSADLVEYGARLLDQAAFAGAGKLANGKGHVLSDQHTHTLEARVASSETAIIGLAQSLDKAMGLMNRLETSVETGFRDLNDRISDSRKPQYVLVFGTIFGAMSVLLTIIGGVGSIVLNAQARDITRIEERAVTNSDKIFTNREAISSLTTHLDDTVSNILAQETRLQNETRLVASNLETRITAVESRLQDEIKREKDTALASIAQIQDANKLSAELTRESIRERAVNGQRISSLEKQAETMLAKLTLIAETGSPISDRRLTKLEGAVNNLGGKQ